MDTFLAAPSDSDGKHKSQSHAKKPLTNPYQISQSRSVHNQQSYTANSIVSHTNTHFNLPTINNTFLSFHMWCCIHTSVIGHVTTWPLKFSDLLLSQERRFGGVYRSTILKRKQWDIWSNLKTRTQNQNAKGFTNVHYLCFNWTTSDNILYYLQCGNSNSISYWITHPHHIKMWFSVKPILKLDRTIYLPLQTRCAVGYGGRR